MFSSMLSRGRVFFLALLVVAAVLVGVPSVGLAVVAEDVPVVDGGNPWNDDEEYVVEGPGWRSSNYGDPWDDDEEYVSATAQPTISAQSGDPWDTDEYYLLPIQSAWIREFSRAITLLTAQ